MYGLLKMASSCLDNFLMISDNLLIYSMRTSSQLQLYFLSKHLTMILEHLNIIKS